MNEVKVPEDEVEVFNFNIDEGIIGLMDCSGSNLIKINEDIPNVVKLIATSKKDSKAKERSEEFGVPLIEIDFEEFEKEKGIEKGDYFKALKARSNEEAIKTREEVCKLLMNEILSHGKKLPIFAAGFMSLLSEEFVENFFILNVHPGDLVYKEEKKRKLVGDGWRPSAKAIMRRHEYLYSSIHLMTSEMDEGPVLLRGYALPIDYDKLSKLNLEDLGVLKKVGEACQEALKHLGDHVIAGAAFMDLFEGNWGMHKSGDLAYRFKEEWFLVPDGIMIEDHVENNPNSPFKRSKEFIQEKIDEFHETVNSME